jgi:DNA-binding response OmpR family regulator
MRLAIAEPDDVVSDVLAFAAQKRGHQAVCVPDVEALFNNLPFAPSVVVASVRDANQPTLKSIERVRKHFPDVAVFITAERLREPGPSLFLRAGANQLVPSPYNPSELILRAENWLASHTANSAAIDDSVRMADLEVALEKYAATKNGQRLTLTKLELRLLYCLCEHHPHLAPLERLLTFGWDTLGDPDAALIKTHISHIRHKLREAGGVPFEITSRQTIGYVLSHSGQ